MGKKQARRTAVQRAFPLLVCYGAVLLFALGPLALLGQGISLPLLDWMDGEITAKVLLGRNLRTMQDYFLPQVPQMMQGAAVWSGASSTLLYAWFSPFIAYGMQCFLTVSAAYWGMVLFLRRLIPMVVGSEQTARRACADGTAACAEKKAAGAASKQAGAGAAVRCALESTRAACGVWLCAAIALIFACLPFYTVYDLNTMGIPLLLWALLVLWQAGQRVRGARKARGVRALQNAQDAQDAHAAQTTYHNLPATSRALVCAAYAAVLAFGAGSTLAFSGYFIVGFLLLFLLVQLVRRRFASVRHLAVAFVVLCVLYGAANLGLVQSVFGLEAIGFVSHRVVYAPGTLAMSELASEFTSMLLHGQYHAGSKHLLVLMLAVVLLCATLLFYKHLTREQKRLWLFGVGLFGVCIGIAAFYALCGTALYARLTALLGSAIASFQFDRLYFAYPTLWYTLLATLLALCTSAGPTLVSAAMHLRSNWLRSRQQHSNAPSGAKATAFAPCVPQTLTRGFVAFVLACCFAFVLRDNYLSDNWRAVVTGVQPEAAVTWRQFFAEDVFARIRAALPRSSEGEKGAVVTSLGMSPAIALYNGFVTVDGYSSNYSLSYHEQFGKVLQDEIGKDAALASYYYDWGNRCYLYTPQLGKDFSYRCNAQQPAMAPLEHLAFDWDTLREMGGTHVLSIAPIAEPAQYGLTDCGKFDGEYYSVYVYAL